MWEIAKGGNGVGGRIRTGETQRSQQIITEKYGMLIRPADKTRRGLPTLGRGSEWPCRKTQRDF